MIHSAPGSSILVIRGEARAPSARSELFDCLQSVILSGFSGDFSPEGDAYLAVVLPRLESIVRNFLPIATNNVDGAHGSLYVRRITKHFGEEVEVLDENAFEEQRKAAEVVLKTVEQARKVLGIGLTETGKDEAALTESRMQSLIFQAVTNNLTIEGSAKSTHVSDAMESGGF